MLIIDAHLDLGMNAMEWNRDLRKPVAELRKREEGLTDKPDRGKGTVAFPELRKGNVGLVVATQIARFVEPDSKIPGWNSPEQAWAQTQGQLSWYKSMEDAGEMIQITDLAGLQKHLELWSDEFDNYQKPIGYILSLEGADSLVTIQHLERAYEYGLRALGPAHYGPGRYANGTNSTGKMNANGLALLRKMEELNIILDMTHLCDDAFWQAMDHFYGYMWASHNNCRALVDHNRQFSDEMIRELISRGAVIGGALDAWMIVPHWEMGISSPESLDCDLHKMIDHIDHICQLAGNTLHVGIGSDLDGAFGKEQSPYDIDTIADLQKIPILLLERGIQMKMLKTFYTGTGVHFLLRHGEID